MTRLPDIPLAYRRLIESAFGVILSERNVVKGAGVI